MILWISTSDLLSQVAAVLVHVYMKRWEPLQFRTMRETMDHCTRVWMANRHFNLDVILEKTLW